MDLIKLFTSDELLKLKKLFTEEELRKFVIIWSNIYPEKGESEEYKSLCVHFIQCCVVELCKKKILMMQRIY